MDVNDNDKKSVNGVKVMTKESKCNNVVKRGKTVFRV